jgi:hypothetical protein
MMCPAAQTDSHRCVRGVLVFGCGQAPLRGKQPESLRLCRRIAYSPLMRIRQSHILDGHGAFTRDRWFGLDHTNCRFSTACVTCAPTRRHS